MEKFEQSTTSFSVKPSGRRVIRETKALVVTGSPYRNGKQSEIIDLEDATFECTLVNQFPVELYFAIGGLVGETPMVCGGSLGSGSKSKACYTLQGNGAWMEDQSAALNRARVNAATGLAVWNNQLVVAGGYSPSLSQYLQTIELVSPNTRAKTLSFTLPLGLGLSCIVKWDDDTFYVIGGYSTRSSRSKETFFINMRNETVTQGPELIDGRRYLACQEMIVGGEPFIVVAGGSGAKTRTEMLSKSNFANGWVQGVDLPVEISHHALVASSDKKFLYAIGSAGSNINDIYKLSCQSNRDCQWTEAETKLKYGRFGGVAMHIPDDLASKLCK